MVAFPFISPSASAQKGSSFTLRAIAIMCVSIALSSCAPKPTAADNTTAQAQSALAPAQGVAIYPTTNNAAASVLATGTGMAAATAPVVQPARGVAIGTTNDKIWLVGSSQMNMLNGESKPAVVRVYQLATADAFADSSYIELLDNDVAILGDSLVDKRVFDPLFPGERRGEPFTLKEGANFIAAFVEYINYEMVEGGIILPITDGQLPPSLCVQVKGVGAEFTHLG